MYFITHTSLNKREQKSAIPVVVSSTFRGQTIDHSKHRTLSLRMLGRRVNIKENLATLIDFPQLEVLPHPNGGKTTVYSLAMAEYIKEAV